MECFYKCKSEADDAIMRAEKSACLGDPNRDDEAVWLCLEQLVMALEVEFPDVGFWAYVQTMQSNDSSMVCRVLVGCDEIASEAPLFDGLFQSREGCGFGVVNVAGLSMLPLVMREGEFVVSSDQGQTLQAAAGVALAELR